MIEVLQSESTFDFLDLHGAHPARYPFLLESVAHNSASARYDILFAFPGRTLQLDTPDSLTGAGLPLSGTDFLDNLDRWRTTDQAVTEDTLSLPFSGGWFVYLGYELAAQIERRLRLPHHHRSDLPIAYATRIPAAFIRDHQTSLCYLLAETGHAGLLEQMQADVKNLRPASCFTGSLLKTVLQEDSPAQFLTDVARIQRYITEGDVFQVNLSRGWQGELQADITPADVYRQLRHHNPAPFAGLACHGNTAIISSSPERLVRVRADLIETRPIAGTRPRGPSDATTLADTRELLAHPKERAEHIMLIDLERNDLGRVCIPGSVQVNELMATESYAHVHHIVSNVQGRLRASTTPGQVLRALFPGGTITGCPKVRCMEIIAELEQTPRGAYTGAMGYINRDGSMDFNILIRTLVQQDRHISFRAGSGIVADSQPERELEETRAKARGMLLALGQGRSSC